MLLKGQVAVVTGGAGGIGKSICERFAEEGVRAIIVADIREEPREGGPSVMETLAKSGCDVRFVNTDVTRGADMARAVAAADEFGGVTIMVNNAGIAQGASFLEMTEEQFDTTMAINARGVFLGAQAAARSMVSGKRRGAIINMSSRLGDVGHAMALHYGASKAAVKLMTFSMAAALGPHGIRVNAIQPGDIATAMGGDTEGKDVAWTIPLGREGDPREVADAAVYLASDLASYVNGVALLLDGGMSNTYPGIPARVAE
ncbi:glucose 1-dehydrogenase [Sphingopyxis sp.]|uniref:SDR family NAD(P)-dependent oxidoreductase n=1 Tax=Sphingopyxis sp. TaxID=1908224 RepID=UPI002D78D1F5|nr:glucose 1-dehydrogenase [Sphingopyxis sp.]HET6523097.1 glucose 1-dehydrogenase [Sphingopyxis sp.]